MADRISVSTSHPSFPSPPGSRCSSITDGGPDTGHREPRSDSSSVPPSHVSTPDDDEPDNNHTGERSNEVSSDRSSRTLVGQTDTIPSPSRSSSSDVHHTDQVPPNDQTASSVMDQMHAVIHQRMIDLTTTAWGLNDILLGSRAQLESTREALDQTLQYLVGNTDEFPFLNLNRRLGEQTVRLGQQLESIDMRRKRIETRLRQTDPRSFTTVFPHGADTDNHDSNSPVEEDHASDSSTLL